MELVRIEKLLEKYFEATTTEAEERELKSYFAQDNIAPHLEQYSPMFAFFSKAKEERFTKQVPLKPRRNYYRWLSVAAVVVLFFGIYFGVDSYQTQVEAELAERQEAERVYEQTKEALDLLAANFGKGTEKMAYLNEFEETKQKIYNAN